MSLYARACSEKVDRLFDQNMLQPLNLSESYSIKRVHLIGTRSREVEVNAFVQ